MTPPKICLIITSTQKIDWCEPYQQASYCSSFFSHAYDRNLQHLNPLNHLNGQVTICTCSAGLEWTWRATVVALGNYSFGAPGKVMTGTRSPSSKCAFTIKRRWAIWTAECWNKLLQDDGTSVVGVAACTRGLILSLRYHRYCTELLYYSSLDRPRTEPWTDLKFYGRKSRAIEAKSASIMCHSVLFQIWW